MSSSLNKVLALQDIDKIFINHFIRHLSDIGYHKVTQKNTYSRVKSVLMRIRSKELLDKNIFPKNPFPNTNKLKKGQKSLSGTERKDVALAIKKELRRIDSEDDLLTSKDLSICVLAIALRTGLNPTPILDLTINCIKPHPLKKDRFLLVSYKRRGNNTKIQILRKSQNIENVKTILTDVYFIIEMVAKRNAKLRAQHIGIDHLFVFENKYRDEKPIGFLSTCTLLKRIQSFVEEYKLVDCDGKKLILNPMRLRKTFINHIWELSGGDPLVTASLAGHSIKVSNDHYLEAPIEAEMNWRLMGEIRNVELYGEIDSKELKTENTPLASCKDTKNGHLAPKNGNHCVNFLGCFRCRSFVVTEDDLYRLLSFYWVLVRERKNSGAKKWSRYYSHIIRIIDNQILPHYEMNKVIKIKKGAKDQPHPFWKESVQLDLAGQ